MLTIKKEWINKFFNWSKPSKEVTTFEPNYSHGVAMNIADIQKRKTPTSKSKILTMYITAFDVKGNVSRFQITFYEEWEGLNFSFCDGIGQIHYSILRDDTIVAGTVAAGTAKA